MFQQTRSLSIDPDIAAVSLPTRSNNLLTVLAAEPAFGVHDVRVDDAGLLSDHQLVAAMLSVAMPQRHAIQTEFRSIKNLDVVQFEQLLWQSSLFT